MKKSVLILCAVFFLSTAALAGSAQYQVTGPVLEVRDDAIVVQKGNEKWEIARDKATSISGDLKLIFDSLKCFSGTFLSQVTEIVISDFVPNSKCSAIYRKIYLDMAAISCL